jgi:hypothetical protein
MAWVGIDRGVQALERLAGVDVQEIHQERLEQLRTLRAAVRTEIMNLGVDRERRTFMQSYGSARLDASVLLMPHYGFLPWTDERVIGTVETICRDLTQDGLVLRYATEDDHPNIDGVPGTEGVFLAASFWLADALHEIGRTDEATDLFERLLALRNDVGLLSEEYDPATGHHLGNTPQALSHAAVVTTALRLGTPAHHRRRDRRTGRRKLIEVPPADSDPSGRGLVLAWSTAGTLSRDDDSVREELATPDSPRLAPAESAGSAVRAHRAVQAKGCGHLEVRL